MASARPILILWLSALSLAAPARSGTPPAPALAGADAFGGLHLMRPGDTPESLARSYLGSESAAAELLLFNRLTRAQFLSYTNGLAVAIPGSIRLDAQRRLEEAAEWRGKALQAQAQRYASNTFSRADLSLKGAQASRGEAAYDQAAALGLLSAHQFKASAAQADLAAPSDAPGILQRLFGQALVRTTSAAEGKPIAAGQPLAPGAIVTLGARDRGEIHWPGGVQAFLEQNTHFTQEEARQDPRTQMHRYALLLASGALHVRVDPSLTNTTVRVQMGRSTFTMGAGAEARFEQIPKGPTLVSVYAGGVRLGDRTLPAGSGWLEAPGAKPMTVPLPSTPATPWQPTSTGDQTPTLLLAAAGDKHVQRVELARDEHFLDMAQVIETPQPTATPEILAPGNYWWRKAPRLPGQPLGQWGSNLVLRVHSNLGIQLEVRPPALEKGGERWISALHTFEPRPADADHSVASFEYALDEDPYRPLSDVLLITRPGKHRLRVRGVAQDGTRGAEWTGEYRVDNEPPTLRYILSETTDGKLKVELSAADEAGVKTIEVQLGDEDFKPCPELLVIDPKVVPVLRVRCTDGVGNLSRVRELELNKL